MKTLIKKVVRKFLKKLNVRISRYDKTRPRYLKAVESIGINIIFDIGANQGQFALSLLDNNYSGKLISFEPTKNAYNKLRDNAEGYSNWIIHERAAVGEKYGETVINIAGNEAASSSILPMGKTHEKSAPNANYIGSETTKLITIDDIFEDYFSSSDKCLLKIDVQGYEEQVLMGAMNSLRNVNAVKLECALVSLYEGDKTFEHYFDFFKDNGFELYDIETGFSNLITGQLLQFDALFVRI